MRTLASFAASAVVVLVALSGCKDGKEPSTQTTTGSTSTPSTGAPAALPANAAEHAEVGKPAPDFTLKDLDGKAVRLSSFKGKTVVLEWFNPGCPFVKASHTKGS